MAQEAWGRWGVADEAGSANFAGAEEARRAAALVKTGRVFHLGQPLSPKMPTPAHRAGVLHFMGRDGGDYAAGAKRPDGFQFSEDTIVLPLHVGTHMDALCHCWYDDKLYNGFSGDTVRSTNGAFHCGIDKMPPLVTRGVLLDLVKLTGAPLPPGRSVSRAELQAAAQAAGVAIERGDAVLLRTGWFESCAGNNPSFDEEPGIDVEAGVWLADAGVALVGADNFAIEVLPFPPGKVFPVHQRLVRDYGMALLEGLVLAPLAEFGATTFLFMAAPLRIVGATGSPVAPVAVV